MTLLSFSATNILPFPSFIQQPYSSTKTINTNMLNTNIIKTQILTNKNTQYFPVCLATPKQQKTRTPVKKNTNSSSTSKRVPNNNNNNNNNNNSTSSNKNKNGESDDEENVTSKKLANNNNSSSRSSKNNNSNSSSSGSKNNNNNSGRSNKNNNIISIMSNGEINDEENNGSNMMTKRVAKNNNKSNNDEENEYVLEKSLSSKKLANNKNSNIISSISNGEINNGSNKNSSNNNERYRTPPIPNPPAGFVVDAQGNVLIVSNKRIATIVDPSNNLPLECIIRRVFTSSRGDDCMLLCPVDMPVQILKSTNVEGWSAVSDDEVEAILPNAAYALAKIHIHLVHSGFCYTARGGFCYTEDDIFEFRTDDGQDVDGLPTEGIEITCFHLDGSHYMVYTPSDPLLFVVVKDQNGQLQILDDDLLEDPAVISAIDEETEFNALVEEEAALLDSLLGKR